MKGTQSGNGEVCSPRRWHATFAAPSRASRPGGSAEGRDISIEEQGQAGSGYPLSRATAKGQVA